MKEKTKENFIKDLKALLSEYRAEITAEDHYSGYAECGEDIRIAVEFDAIYDKDSNLVRNYEEVDLGKIINGEK